MNHHLPCSCLAKNCRRGRLVDDVSGYEQERRHAPRTRPDEDARDILVWLSPERRVPATICDIAAGGIGILVDRCDGFECEFQVLIQYQGARLLSSVTNVGTTCSGRCRIGIRWEQRVSSSEGTSLPAHVGNGSNNEVILVERASNGSIILEQSQTGRGASRIVVSGGQLKEILEALADSTSWSDAEKILPGQLSPDITLRFFAVDGSFSITQATNQLFGRGEMRQLFHPIDISG